MPVNHVIFAQIGCKATLCAVGSKLNKSFIYLFSIAYKNFRKTVKTTENA
jgi:hypothetical protein